MNQFKRILCLVLVALFVIACVGCDNTQTPSGSAGHRPPHGDGEVKVEEVVKEDNDHVFDYKLVEWDGPDGYVIIVPAGNTAAKNTAKYLQNYFKNALDISLSIATDKNAAKDKEILIGKTNRKESDKNIAEADINVAIKGTKLVFDGGHDVTVDTAVKKFTRVTTEAKKAATFKLTTDFMSTLDNKYEGQYAGYKYVWGDEFEGEGIGSSWFQLIAKMAGNDTAELSKEKNVVDVNDGRLKLRSLFYFNNNRQGTVYRIPCSPVTHETMNFRYGYAEIRARVPYKWGCFPSWWMQSTTAATNGKVKKHPQVMFEIDVFEVFNCWELTPGHVQWYTADFNYTGKYPDCWKLKEINHFVPAGQSIGITYAMVGSNPQVYKWPETNTNLPYEYHTYGFEWTPTVMKMYIDGKKYGDFDISNPRDSYDEEMLPGTNSPSYFHDPQGFIFNNHIFLEGISLASKSIDLFPESLPSEYFIDWIRLYQTDEYDSKIYFDDQRDYLN